jgi:hypothetical protein
VTTPSDPLPADLTAAHAMILAQREQLTLARSEVTVGRLEIERLKLMLAKARREQFGQSSERGKLRLSVPTVRPFFLKVSNIDHRRCLTWSMILAAGGLHCPDLTQRH